MQPYRMPGHLLFAIGMIGLGILGLIFGDFALVWQAVPEWVPGRRILAYACGVLMLASGIGLPWPRFSLPASRVLLVYLLLWLLLLRVPQLAIAPLTVVSWSGCGENLVLLAGGFALFTSGRRIAQIFFGLALIPCGLAHFAYAKATAELVPVWLPWHFGWAYFTGAAYIAAGMGVLVGIYARLAATMAAVMMSAFTLLVWIPGVAAEPKSRLQWTALFVSWAIAAAGWVVADSYADTPRLEAGNRGRKTRL